MRVASGPSLVPDPAGHTFYMVIERYRGDAFFPETTLDRTDLEQVIGDLTAGQYENPLEVVAFNPTEGWSRNVTDDIAAEIQRRADFLGKPLGAAAADFVERNTRFDRQLNLRLVG